MTKAPPYRIASLLIVVTVVATLVPVLSTPASAIRCQIQIDKVDYPSIVDPGQAFEVKTNLTVGCSTSMIDISGRVDLIDLDSQKTVSISGLHFGYISEPGKTFNLTVTNEAQAPPTEKDWKLKVSTVVFAGGDPVASAENSFSVQVGAGDRTVLWLGIIVAAIVVAILLYLSRTRRGKTKTRR